MIFCADTHLSDLCPVSRSDRTTWIDVQIDKLEQMTEFGRKQKQKHLILAGDMFHKYSDSTTLVNRVMAFICDNKDFHFYLMYGNHDLKNHNVEYNIQTALLTIGFLPNVTVIKGTKSCDIENKQVDFIAYGQKLKDYGGDIAVIHTMAYKNKPWADAPESGNYKNVADKLEGYELIVCGHNHERFIANYDGCVFLNCGSMTRRTIDQKEFDPHFYIMKDWDIEPVPFEINEDVWDFKAKDVDKVKTVAMEEVARKFKEHIVVDLDFEDNLDKYCKHNNISIEDQDYILANMEKKK